MYEKIHTQNYVICTNYKYLTTWHIMQYVDLSLKKNQTLLKNTNIFTKLEYFGKFDLRFDVITSF